MRLVLVWVACVLAVACEFVSLGLVCRCCSFGGLAFVGGLVWLRFATCFDFEVVCLLDVGTVFWTVIALFGVCDGFVGVVVVALFGCGGGLWCWCLLVWFGVLCCGLMFFGYYADVVVLCVFGRLVTLFCWEMAWDLFCWFFDFGWFLRLRGCDCLVVCCWRWWVASLWSWTLVVILFVVRT